MFPFLNRLLFTPAENEQKITIKELEGEEKLLLSHREIARKLQSDKAENEEIHRNLKSNVSKLKKEVETAEVMIKKLADLREYYTDLNTQIDRLNFETNQLMDREDPLKSSLMVSVCFPSLCAARRLADVPDALGAQGSLSHYSG